MCFCYMWTDETDTFLQQICFLFLNGGLIPHYNSFLGGLDSDHVYAAEWYNLSLGKRLKLSVPEIEITNRLSKNQKTLRNLIKI